MEEDKTKQVKKNQPKEVTESYEEEHIPLSKKTAPTSQQKRKMMPRKSTLSATTIASQEPLPKHSLP